MDRFEIEKWIIIQNLDLEEKLPFLNFVICN
jgi:hypothetical protein